MSRAYHRIPLLIAAMTLVALGLGALALWMVERQLIARTGQSLAQLAAMIADHLDHDLFERYGDLKVASESLRPLLRDPAGLTHSLNRIQEYSLMYRWLAVVNAQGRVVAATNPADVGEDQSQTAWFKAARAAQDVYVQDVEISQKAPHDRAVLFAAPIRDDRGAVQGVLAAKVALDQLEDVIGRAVATFQERSGAGSLEWQLLRRDGLVIADSRLREEMTVNLLKQGLPSATLALTGQPGYVEERHLRRQVPVLTGYAQTQGYGEFLGLQWSLLVRMDRAEVLAPIHSVLWKLAVGGAVIWLPMFVLLVWLTHRLRLEWASEQALRAEHEATLTSIGEAVIVTDHQGRVTFMNPVAEALTGWPMEEAQGQALDTIFRIVNELTRRPVESPVAKVLREGLVVGLANHTVLIARDGTERPIDDSGAPVRDARGELCGVVLVFRDVTEQRQQQQLIQARTQALQILVEAATELSADWELHRTLERLLEWATTLTRAKYGALAVLDATGEKVVDFITVGVSSRQ